MVNSQNKLLKSILDSKQGLHLTTYIKFDGNILRFRKKLARLLVTAEDYLKPILSPEEMKRFLGPVRGLAIDTQTLKQMKGNIGIYRKNDFLRFVSIPTEIEESCYVADSFHIKPLVKWAQQDQDFILVGLTQDSAYLYKGSQSDFKRIDVAIYPEELKKINADEDYQSLKKKRIQKTQLQQTMDWLAGWVDDLVIGSSATVFVTGQKEHVAAFIKKFKSKKLYPETIVAHFTEEKVFEICKNIRSLLRLDSITKLNESLQEFDSALKLNLAKTNIFLIAREAIRGNVKKLVIAEDLNIFGKLDKLSGGVSLHPEDLNHEDDCVLDDLAQAVLLNGGEVVVAKREAIPQRKPLVAVLTNKQSHLYAEVMNMNEATL